MRGDRHPPHLLRVPPVRHDDGNVTRRLQRLDPGRHMLGAVKQPGELTREVIRVIAIGAEDPGGHRVDRSKSLTRKGTRVTFADGFCGGQSNQPGQVIRREGVRREAEGDAGAWIGLTPENLMVSIDQNNEKVPFIDGSKVDLGDVLDDVDGVDLWSSIRQGQLMGTNELFGAGFGRGCQFTVSRINRCSVEGGHGST